MNSSSTTDNRQLQLVIPFDDLKQKLEGMIRSAKDLVDLKVTTDEELASLESMSIDWIERASTILKSSFNNPANEFFDDFRTTGRSPIRFGGQRPSLTQLAKEKKDYLLEKQWNLFGTMRLLSVLDAVVFPEKVDLNIRARYTVEEKLDLILDKLYDLYDDSNYSLTSILRGNGIIITASDEVRGFQELLNDSGYTEAQGGIGSDIYARITVRGKSYVENRRKVYQETYDDLNKTESELVEIIREIKEQLIKQGLGQEVLFNELQELKDLYPKLNKKNWGELLKGKLVDLALSKVVEWDTIKFVYESLTHHTLRLP
jgi:hypothetical protein